MQLAENKLKSLIFDWYRNPAIKFEIIKCLYKREMAYINKCSDKKDVIRMMKCHNTYHYDFLMDYVIQMEKKNQPCNLYYSLARYKNGIPNQNFALGHNNDEWTKNHYLEMETYDFLLDIDSPNIEEIPFAYDSALEIKTLFDKWNIPYELRFSGMGFHFIIPFEKFRNLQQKTFSPYDNNNIYDYFMSLARYFKDDYSELIDHKIYDSRRLCKIPYSISYYPDVDRGLMCFPFLNDNQFRMFNGAFPFRLFDVENILPESMYKRGTNLFNSNGTCDYLEILKESI